MSFSSVPAQHPLLCRERCVNGDFSSLPQSHLAERTPTGVGSPSKVYIPSFCQGPHPCCSQLPSTGSSIHWLGKVETTRAGNREGPVALGRCGVMDAATSLGHSPGLSPPTPAPTGCSDTPICQPSPASLSRQTSLDQAQMVGLLMRLRRGRWAEG